jgi:hypothetical protein
MAIGAGTRDVLANEIKVFLLTVALYSLPERGFAC